MFVFVVAVQTFLLKIYEQLNEIQVLKIVFKTVNVNKVYVDSNIVSVKRRYGFSVDESSDDRQRVTTYREFFGETPTNVYLLGSSGRGKTTFCHHMVDHWCQEIRSKHGGAPEQSEETYLSDTFDFIFFISLEKAGSIADMIRRQLFIENQHYYEFVMKYLLTNAHRVLLVLDDLDEWQMINPGTLPSREHLNQCITLITLRHSEISTIPLKSKDYLYEIKELCEESVRKLVENIAVQLCGDRDKRRVHKCLEDLQKQHINEIPMVLTFSVFSWYKYESIGQSRVDTHARIIRFLLSTLNNEHVQDDCPKLIEKLPPIFSALDLSKASKHIILRLSSFAFEFLSDHGPSTSEKDLAGLLGVDILRCCLRTGLLVITRRYESQVTDDLYVKFYHRSIQDFLAATFIATGPSKEQRLSKLLNHTSTYQRILDCSDVFVFVCGLMPEHTSKLSKHITDVASQSKEILAFRYSLDERYSFARGRHMSTYKFVKMTQKLQLRCLREAENNLKFSQQKQFVVETAYGVPYYNAIQKDPITISLSDVMMTDTVDDRIVTLALKQDPHDVKSVFVDMPLVAQTDTVQRIIAKADSLVRLHLDESCSKIIYLLGEKKFQLLQSLTISLTPLPDNNNIPLWLLRLPSLKFLSMSVHENHDKIDQIMDGLWWRFNLLEVHLERVRCVDHLHNTNECTYELDLRKHSHLKHLRIGEVYANAIYVPISVQYLAVSGKTKNVSSIWRCLNVPTNNVVSLTIGQAPFIWEQHDFHALYELMPKLNLLKFLTLLGFKYYGLVFSPSARLKEIFLYDVMFDKNGWMKFLDSLNMASGRKTVIEIVDSFVFILQGETINVVTDDEIIGRIQEQFNEVSTTRTSLKSKTKRQQ
ncbi:hypothetical protein DPMN_098404 [Dreissena polymorpha]|uniref:NACHT domain-containing protein n=1 Tax=Dreissena polymorpha TaxID=45954 RepID=A0A9D4LDJ3_DREPO|nr:hypothetical protein DPMN_098404 [Dreissena polymorpha]